MGAICYKDYSIAVVAGCNPGDFVPVTEAAIATLAFTTVPSVNEFLEVTVPVGKRGIYQCRFVSGAQAIACPINPADEFWTLAFSDFRIEVDGVPDTANWVTADWSANVLNTVGWSADGEKRVQVDAVTPAFLLEGLSGTYNAASVETLMTNLSLTPRYQKFCFESPSEIAEGQTIRLELNQELYSACGGRPNIIHVNDGPTFEIIRVGYTCI